MTKWEFFVILHDILTSPPAFLMCISCGPCSNAVFHCSLIGERTVTAFRSVIPAVAALIAVGGEEGEEKETISASGCFGLYPIRVCQPRSGFANGKPRIVLTSAQPLTIHLLKYSYSNDFSPYAHSTKLNLRSLISSAIGYLCGHDIGHMGILTKLTLLHGQRGLLRNGRLPPGVTFLFIPKFSFWVVGPNKLQV